MTIAKDCSGLQLTTNTTEFEDILSCSRTTDTNCFFTAVNPSDTSDRRVCKFDFTNTENISYTQHNDSNYVISDLAPVDADNIIVNGFDGGSNPNKFLFYSTNHSSTSINWAVEADTFGKYFNNF